MKIHIKPFKKPEETCQLCGQHCFYIIDFHGKMVCFYPCYCELAEAYNEEQKQAIYDLYHKWGQGN